MRPEEVDGTEWDALVIGAGPAGSMAARGLAGAGARTLLVERAAFPRRKVCGACLNGHALAVLRDAGLGSLVARSEGSACESSGGRGNVLVTPESASRTGETRTLPLPRGALRRDSPEPTPIRLDAIELRFDGRAARLPLPDGVALSRARFDNALAGAAAEAGASVLFETQAHVRESRDGSRDARLVHRGRSMHVKARVVLDASGLGGTCLPSGAAPKVRIAPGSRVGAGCVISYVPGAYRAGTIFMGAGRHGYVGLVRVEDQSLNIAAAFSTGFLRTLGSPGLAASAILEEAGFPAIPDLESADWRGTPALTRQTRPLGDDRLFLLGDAAGYVEPFTGEGMAWALASGRAIVPLALRAIEGWSPRLLREWSALHRRLVGHRQLVCRAAGLALRRPWLIPIVFGTLARWPGASGYVLRRLNAPSSAEVS